MQRIVLLFFLLLTNFPLLQGNLFTAENGYNNCDFYSNGEHSCLESQLSDKVFVVFDVGANVGQWSLMASKQAPKAKVYAFEPHPSIFNVLKSNTLDRSIECHPFAVSDKNSREELYVWGDDSDEEKSGLNGLHYRPVLKKILKKQCSSLSVETITLDQFCQVHKIDHIDYLKIDTEGHEIFVLRGAEQLLANQAIDKIQFEYGGCYIDASVTLEAVFSLLKGYGYEIYRILPHRLLKIDLWQDDLENYQYSNYIAILP